MAEQGLLLHYRCLTGVHLLITYPVSDCEPTAVLVKGDLPNTTSVLDLTLEDCDVTVAQLAEHCINRNGLYVIMTQMLEILVSCIENSKIE